MNALMTLLSHDVAERIGWALFHSLWQATAIAVLLTVALRLLGRSSAPARYGVACMVLAAMVALPAATGAWLLPRRAAGVIAPAQPSSPVPAVKTAATPAGSSIAPTRVALEPARERSWRDIGWRLEPALPYAVCAWLIGVLALSLRHLLVWTRIRQLQRTQIRPADGQLCHRLQGLARALGVRRTVQLVESALVQVPTMIGWLYPMILLPASALTGLNREQLEALLLHELAHIRRHDYLVNLVQTVVEIVGFYHPAVWWVSRRIRIERENCCDDLAAQALGDNLRYAKALASMEDIRSGRLELALAASGGSLLARIRRLVGRVPPEPSLSAWAPLVAMAVLLLCLAAPLAAARLGAQTASARVVRFAADRSVGALYLREWDFPTDSYEPSINWQWLGEARGDVTVPAGKALRLDLHEDAWQSGSPFATLRPDDVQMLDFSKCKSATDSVLAEVAKLRGLKALSLVATAITGEGLGHLKELKGLKWLFLGSTYLDDEGAAHLADLGALDYLNLRYTKITDAALAHVGKIRGLKWLALDGTAVRDEGLAHLKNLTSLQALSLPQCKITDTGLGHLAGLTEMRMLYLIDTQVSDAGLVHLARMTNLRELRLVDTKVTGGGLVHLQRLKSLEYLELPFADITDEHLAHLSGLDRLQKLYVISDVLTEKGFQSLAGLKALEELQTGGPGITDATAAVLATFPALKAVWIQRAPALTDEGLAQLAKLKSLTKLELSQVNITGAGLTVLQGLPALQELALADLFIGEGEFSALGRLHTLERLRIGESWSNINIPFTDQDMAALAHLKNLKNLMIASKRISDAGLRHLSGLQSLQYLGLTCPGVTDAGLTHLEGLRALRTLSLVQTRVTAEGAKRLEKTIPGLECQRR